MKPIMAFVESELFNFSFSSSAKKRAIAAAIVMQLRLMSIF